MIRAVLLYGIFSQGFGWKLIIVKQNRWRII